ncbi:uncharacterized protein METZ01_LOCUS276183, partial [marine metagenome]
MKSFKPNKETSEKAHVSSLKEYQEIYDYSISNPKEFWAEQAERITWFKKWDQVWNWDFKEADISWYNGAQLNACYNCVDRHVENGYGNETALIWEGNDPSENKTLTYNDLLKEVQLAANSLKNLGVEKGDRVCIYMQMIPEL